MGCQQGLSMREAALSMLRAWYDSERPTPEQEPERYVVCAALAVLERARGAYPLTPEDFVTEGSQVRTSGSLIKEILSRYGEKRTYAREGGRTTRGTRPAAERFAGKLNALDGFSTAPQSERLEVIKAMQGWLAERATAYFNRRRIEAEIVLEHSAEQIIAAIVTAADKRKLAGPVSQHLVGAKLALRYPEAIIENYSATTADLQLGRSGDFAVGDTIFHVTMAPMEAVLDKCRGNLQNGFRAILLVPNSRLQAARQLADGKGLADRVGVHAIETFVGQNIEEMSEFRKTNFATRMRALLEKYNERVAAVETDQSLLIEIPENL